MIITQPTATMRAFRRQCIIPGESTHTRRHRLHNMVEDKAIDELAPKLGLIPPSEYRQGNDWHSERMSGRTTTAILRALVRLQSGVNSIIFIGHDYDQANDCKHQILRLAWEARIAPSNNQVIALSARDNNLDTRLRGVLSRSIVIDPGAIQYISPEAMAVIEALHP